MRIYTWRGFMMNFNQLRENSFTIFNVSKLTFNSAFFPPRWDFLHHREKLRGTLMHCFKNSRVIQLTVVNSLGAHFFERYLLQFFYPLYQYRWCHCRSSHTISVCWGRASRGVSCPDQMGRKKAISDRSGRSMWYVESVPSAPSANRVTSKNPRIINIA